MQTVFYREGVCQKEIIGVPSYQFQNFLRLNDLFRRIDLASSPPPQRFIPLNEARPRIRRGIKKYKQNNFIWNIVHRTLGIEIRCLKSEDDEEICADNLIRYDDIVLSK